MKTVLIVAALAVSLGGCAGLLGGTEGLKAVGGSGDNTASVLGNLQGCYRRYTGSISAGLGAGAAGSFTIVCDPKGVGDPDGPPVVALKDLGKPGTGTEPAS